MNVNQDIKPHKIKYLFGCVCWTCLFNSINDNMIIEIETQMKLIE
jgi:hypothetical protein